MSVHKKDNQPTCNDGNEIYKDTVLLTGTRWDCHRQIGGMR